MKVLKALVLTCLLLVTAAGTEATQRRSSGRRSTPVPPTATPKASPVAAPVAETPTRPLPPRALAIVNGQTLTTADLDPEIRQEVEGLEGKLAETRLTILDVTINTILLEMKQGNESNNPAVV